MNRTQLTLVTPSKTETKNAWAFAARKFAAKTPRNKVLVNASRRFSNYVITACSKEAKTFGVNVGMNYEDAKNANP